MYNPVHPAGMVWVGYMVTILLKIVPPKQLPAAIPDELAERLAHGSYSNNGKNTKKNF